jgi:hypothetical protein
MGMAGRSWRINNQAERPMRRVVDDITMGVEGTQAGRRGWRSTRAVRRAWRIALLLLAGAVVNVAVAWGIALLADDAAPFPLTSGLITHADGTRSVATRLRCPGTSILIGDPVRITDVHASETWPALELPDWARGPRSGPVPDRDPGSWLEYARGWPLLTLACGPYAEPGWHVGPTDLSGHVVGWGVVVHRRGLGGRAGVRVLPLRPVWPATLVNTLFYAAALWVVVRAPRAVRGALRRRRGRCAFCAYDLRGTSHDACPECGRPAPASG